MTTVHPERSYRENAWQIVGATARERLMRIANDCDGSPLCAAEIHIERMADPTSYAEMHLTRDECQVIIDILQHSIEKYDARQASENPHQDQGS